MHRSILTSLLCEYPVLGHISMFSPCYVSYTHFFTLFAAYIHLYPSLLWDIAYAALLAYPFGSQLPSKALQPTLPTFEASFNIHCSFFRSIFSSSSSSLSSAYATSNLPSDLLFHTFASSIARLLRVTYDYMVHNFGPDSHAPRRIPFTLYYSYYPLVLRAPSDAYPPPAFNNHTAASIQDLCDG